MTTQWYKDKNENEFVVKKQYIWKLSMEDASILKSNPFSIQTYLLEKLKLHVPIELKVKEDGIYFYYFNKQVYDNAYHVLQNVTMTISNMKCTFALESLIPKAPTLTKAGLIQLRNIPVHYFDIENSQGVYRRSKTVENAFNVFGSVLSIQIVPSEEFGRKKHSLVSTIVEASMQHVDIYVQYEKVEEMEKCIECIHGTLLCKNGASKGVELSVRLTKALDKKSERKRRFEFERNNNEWKHKIQKMEHQIESEKNAHKLMEENIALWKRKILDIRSVLEKRGIECDTEHAEKDLNDLKDEYKKLELVVKKDDERMERQVEDEKQRAWLKLVDEKRVELENSEKALNEIVNLEKNTVLHAAVSEDVNAARSAILAMHKWMRKDDVRGRKWKEIKYNVEDCMDDVQHWVDSVYKRVDFIKVYFKWNEKVQQIGDSVLLKNGKRKLAAFELKPLWCAPTKDLEIGVQQYGKLVDELLRDDAIAFKFEKAKSKLSDANVEELLSIWNSDKKDDFIDALDNMQQKAIELQQKALRIQQELEEKKRKDAEYNLKRNVFIRQIDDFHKQRQKVLQDLDKITPPSKTIECTIRRLPHRFKADIHFGLWKTLRYPKCKRIPSERAELNSLPPKDEQTIRAEALEAMQLLRLRQMAKASMSTK